MVGLHCRIASPSSFLWNSMMDSTLDVRPRKTPFATQIDFTAARLNEEAARIQALCLTQVEYSCKKTPGLKAVIYGGNCQVTLYSRYCLNKRPVKERLGILGLITLEQARQKHRANRALADQGIDPRRPAPEKSSTTNSTKSTIWFSAGVARKNPSPPTLAGTTTGSARIR